MAYYIAYITLDDFSDLLWKEGPNQVFAIGPIIESKAAVCSVKPEHPWTSTAASRGFLLHKVVTTVSLSSLIKRV